MKITCKQQDLSRGLSTVSHAVSSRSTLPILSNILLSTDQGRLKLSATNLEIGINAWIDAEVLEEGSTTVPAKTMSDLVGSLRSEQLVLSVDESHTLTVKGKGSNATVKGMDPEEFPVISHVPGADSHLTFPARDLKDILGYVTIAAADDDSRPVLTGVHIEARTNEMGDEVVTFAAADAFRLAVLSTTECKNPHLPESALIPAKSLEQLRAILPNEGEVQVWISKAQAIFHAGDVDLVSRLIEGTFPNFRGIIPKERLTRVNIDRADALAALKSLMPFAKDNSGIVKLEIREETETEWGELILTARAEDLGSNVCTLEVYVDGSANGIIFNAKYLQDVLQALKCERVALDIEYNSRPGVVRPLKQTSSNRWDVDSDQDYTYVIMPMSTNK